MPVNNRPGYLRETLDSLRRAKGIDGWKIIFSAEPGCPEVVDMVSKVDWARTTVSVNRDRLGIDANTQRAVDLAFEQRSELNLYLEDDYPVSEDTLLMCEQWDAHLGTFKRAVLGLRRCLDGNGDVSLVARTTHCGLLGAGFCYHHSVYPLLKEWWFKHTPEAGGNGWDWHIEAMLVREKVPVWRPMVSRSQHIGARGTNTQAIPNPGLDSPRFNECINQFRFL